MEAGLPLMEVKKALGFDISKITGLLLSHIHGDHSKYVKQYLNAGITVLSGKETLEALDVLNNINAKTVVPEKGYRLGNFRIIPFPANHDVTCLAFYISHPESGNILFATDTYYLDYTFPGLNHILIEANYSDHILEENIFSGKVHSSMRPRLLQTHMELSTVLTTLKANDLSEVINIVLIHLSDGNSNELKFITEVVQSTGRQVYAAKKGLVIKFNKTPY